MIGSKTPLMFGRWECYDRYDKQIFLGDTVRIQGCVGPYGQIAQATGIVTQQKQMCYGQFSLDAGRVVNYSKFGANSMVMATFQLDVNDKMIGYTYHSVYEHEHETWIEVLGEN
jgi:hypothetical protein